jgi:hypothetical protein
MYDHPDDLGGDLEVVEIHGGWFRIGFSGELRLSQSVEGLFAGQYSVLERRGSTSRRCSSRIRAK